MIPRKVRIFVDRKRPKVPYSEIKRIVESSGLKVTNHDSDLGIVVGGDGLFSLYGRKVLEPLLFVGVKSSSAIESKAHLAATYLEELKQSIEIIKNGKHELSKISRLDVRINEQKVGSIFTDVYVQRGAESNCLRYMLEVEHGKNKIKEYAIADGVVVCTRAGSTGYFSYLDKISSGINLEPERFTLIGQDEIGICHIVPTFTEREKTEVHPLRYTVPIESRIIIRLTRDADARLYGVTERRSGIKLKRNDIVEISKSKEFTTIVKLGPMKPPL